MARRYGLPYQGSKNAIAKWIIDQLPAAEHFYDLFAGGCAVTHAAMESGKYKHVHANDIQGKYPQFFADCIAGKMRDERRVIDRTEFMMLKDADPYIALCWSFGNNRDTYLWAREIEGAKLAACRMIMADTWQERRKYYMQFIAELRAGRAEYERRKAMRDDVLDKIGDIKEYLRGELLAALRSSGKTQAEVHRYVGNHGSGHYFRRTDMVFPPEAKYNKMREILPDLKPYNTYAQALEALEDFNSLESLANLANLANLASLESLKNLESLERLERLQQYEPPIITGQSYSDIDIAPDSVVYCDPPYIGTAGYGVEFDHEAFYQWLRTAERPIYVSEYSMPPDFVSIADTAKTALLCSIKGRKRKKVTERLYVHERFAAECLRRQSQQLKLF